MAIDADLIVSGGTLVDGTDVEPVRADVAIKNGRVSHIGILDQHNQCPGVPRLKADNCVVSPGFIDIHSHSDFTLYVDPRAVSSITQGVTLEVVGNCGHGCAPIVDPELAISNIYGYSAGHPLAWRTFGQYLDALEERQPAVNVINLVPNGNLRMAVVSDLNRPSKPDELRRMKSLLAQSMEEGAYGFSTGLEYGPERACTEEEITELCHVAGKMGRFYATHTRNRPGEARESIDEAIRTCRASGVALQISHISSIARLGNSRQSYEQALDQVKNACSEGLDVGFDMHTRLFGTTNLSTVLPSWALEGDRSDIAQRLKNPATRAKMKQYQSLVTTLVGDDLTGWNRIVLYNPSSHPELSGKSIAEIGREQDADPFDVVYDILFEELDDLHNLMILASSYREEDIRWILEHPNCMVGSDATAMAPGAKYDMPIHHGAFTWAAWFFRYFFRDRAMSLQEAVRRLTSLPAQRLGLTYRGVLQEGAFADLAVFDPTTFAERGTTMQPDQTASGMRHVLVNGTPTLKNGQLTGQRNGKVLRSARCA